MAGGHDMGLIHLSPPEAKKIVLCRPIIHDFSLKMASPRLPVRARAHAPVTAVPTQTRKRPHHCAQMLAAMIMGAAAAAGSRV